MTLLEDDENISVRKRHTNISTIVIGFMGLCVLTLLSVVFWLNAKHEPGVSTSILAHPSQRPAHEGAAEPTQTPEAAAAPEPAPLESLPPARRYVVERISTFIDGDFISSHDGYTVRQFVTVKFRGEDAVDTHRVDSVWSLVRAGDTVVYTPSYQEGQMKWNYEVYFSGSSKAAVRNVAH